MGHPLIIGADERTKLQLVRAYAERNKVSRATLEHAMKLQAAAGDDEEQRGLSQYTLDPGFRAEIPFGYRICFTIEEHPPGWCRHVSISLANVRPGILPNSVAVQEIGHLLGMRMDPFDPSALTYFEGLPNEPPRAVSIIEPISPPG